MKTVSLAIVAMASAAAQAAGPHEAMHIVTPSTTHWMPAPPSLPKGAEMAVIAGDPSKPGPFAFRVRTPAHYGIALHTHPTSEAITVISGEILHGMSADKRAAKIVRTGDFVYLPPHMAHALWSGDRPAVVQVNGTGPFEISYVNPADDPRRR